MSTKLVTISPSNVLQFKAARLAALQDSPIAFGSTHAKEAKLTDVDWLGRCRRCKGDAGIGYLAMDGTTCVGLLLCALHESDITRADAMSMWVAPTHRRLGIGRMLIEAVIDWCSGKSVTTLMLLVTSSNSNAIEFYRRIGFAMTGRTEPYPNDPALFEYELRREIPRESTN